MLEGGILRIGLIVRFVAARFPASAGQDRPAWHWLLRMMHRRAVRLSYRLRAWVYGTVGLLWLTGALFLSARWFLSVETEFGSRAHPLQQWSLLAHGAAAMISLLVFGTLIPVHIRRGWRLRVNRVSGALMVGNVALMIVSGYGLYYFGNEGARSVAAWLHEVSGMLFPIVLVAHVICGARSAGREDGHQVCTIETD